MRALVGLAACAALGCSYPDIAFRDDAATDALADGANDVDPSDTNTPDGAIDSTTSEDTLVAADSAAPDGSPLDTAVAADTATPSDTATPADTAKPPDTGADTSDAAVDAFDAGADAGSGCKSIKALFCRDFDTALTPSDGWSGSFVVGGGTMTLDSTHTRSSPRSLLSSIPSSSGEVSANVHHSFTAATVSTPMRADFWVRFDSVPSGSGPLFFKFARGGGRGVALYVGGGGVTVEAIGSSTTMSWKIPKTIPAATWLHFRVEAAVVPETTGWVRVYVDDMATPALERTGYSTAGAAETSVKMNVGLYDSGANPAVKVWVDDVWFDWL